MTNQSEDEVDKYINTLCERFKRIDPKEYYLAYSGGKDSHLLYWFIKEYAHIDDITVMGVITRLEPYEIAERIKNNCDVIMMSQLEPEEIKAQYGSPCFSKIQDEFIKRYQAGSRSDNTMKFIMGENPIFRLSAKARTLLLEGKLPRISSNCCKYLKKEPVKRFNKESGLKAIIGVRGDEGRTRKAKYKGSFTADKTFTPIWDLSDDLEKKIYKKYDIELPEIYNYVRRTGCLGCPYAKRSVNDVSNIEDELYLANPKLFSFACKYFEESYKVLGVDLESVAERRKSNKRFIA